MIQKIATYYSGFLATRDFVSSKNVQTSSGAHQASFSMGTEFFSRGKVTSA
jgi:hypothetical protein